MDVLAFARQLEILIKLSAEVEGWIISWCDEAALTKDTSAVTNLVALLDNKSSDVQAAAADALGHIGEPAKESWYLLVKLLSNTEVPDFVRDTCAYALGNIGSSDRRVLNTLTEVAADRNSSNRIVHCALRSLDQLRR